jgi:hypothetical protein
MAAMSVRRTVMVTVVTITPRAFQRVHRVTQTAELPMLLLATVRELALQLRQFTQL